MLKPIIIAAIGVAGVAAAIPKERPPCLSLDRDPIAFGLENKNRAASFRSNVVFLGNRLYIGSNGDNFRDYNVSETNSGVYALDRKTGKKIKHFAGEMFGDMDVNGLLLHNNRLYFGNDNEEFLCTDLSGNIQWRNPTSGDIEHEPVLLKTGKGVSIVYAAESGEVKAVDPETGNIRWAYYPADFVGWKPGDNRTLFKVRAWFSNGYGFFIKPLLEDLNRDGVQDLVYCEYGGRLIALNGSSGKKMWESENGVDEGFGILGSGENRRIVGLHTKYSNDYNTQTNEFFFIALNGKIMKTLELDANSSGNGLNFLQIDKEHVLLNGRTETYIVGADHKITSIDRSQKYSDSTFSPNWQGYRNGFSPLFATRTIPLANGKKGVVVLNQHEYSNSNYGFLEIVSLDDRSVIDRISFPSGSEMPPVIEDVDQDGDLDILISGYDGYLYCYELPKY